MCLGNLQTGKQVQQTATPTPAVANAATQSLTAAQNLQSQGFNPYGGNLVAGFSPLQQAGFGQASHAVDMTNPYVQESQNLINNYATTPAPTVNAPTVASQMSPYMNQYVSQALAPQLEAMNQQFAAQNQGLNAAATSSGAFGDARAGIQAANLTNQQDIARQGLIGQAYTNAFNTAIGAGAQDVANQMAAQQATGGFQMQQLQNQLGGANALQNLYGGQLSQLASQYGLSAAAGGTQQQEAQAQLNVPYQQYLMAMQYPFLTQQNLNATVGTGAQAMPAAQTQVTQQPNNAGYQILGALGGAALGIPGLGNLFGGSSGGGAGGGGGGFFPALGSSAGNAVGNTWFGSDERFKEDIQKIGELADGLNVYKFRYKGTKPVQIGLLAQEVEKRYPEAVAKDARGMRYVEYDRATSLAAAMGGADTGEYRMAA